MTDKSPNQQPPSSQRAATPGNPPGSAPATDLPPFQPAPGFAASVPEDDPGGRNITRMIVIALGGLIVFIVVGLIIAIVGGIANSEGVSNFFRILRDFFIIVLALQGILISIALIILVLQVSALVSILRTEIKPIVDETRATMSTIRGTAQFVSKNVTSPVIRTTAVIAGVGAAFREISKIRQNLRPGRVDGDATRISAKRAADDAKRELDKLEKSLNSPLKRDNER